MHVWTILIYVTMSCAQVYKIPVQIYNLAFDPTISFKLSMGNPPQETSAFLHSSFKEFIVVDVECGKPKTNCPSYCKGNDFSTYCDPRCRLTSLGASLVCWNYFFTPLYYHNNSSTYKSTEGKDWNHKLFSTRYLYGKFASDELTITHFDGNSSLFDSNFEFVRGLALDSRISPYDAGSIFGMSPENGTIIHKFYAEKLIAAPLLSLSLNTHYITFGAEDNENCKNWHYHPIVDPNSWTFEMESIKILGIGEFNNKRVLSMPEWPFIQIPKRVTDQLLRDKVIAYNTNDYYFMVDCEFKLTFEFKIQDQILYYDQNDIVFHYNDTVTNTTGCLALISTSEITPYEIYPEWRLGTKFFKRYCHTYDFGQRMIGFAENRLKN